MLPPRPNDALDETGSGAPAVATAGKRSHLDPTPPRLQGRRTGVSDAVVLVPPIGSL